MTKKRLTKKQWSTTGTAAIAGVSIAVGVALTGGALAANAAASGPEEAEPAITGEALSAASAAALAATGQGQVTDTEVGDEESYYEVEVTFDDGTEVDVQLDRAFQVVDVPKQDQDGADG